MGVAQQVSEGFFDLFPHRVAVVMVDFQNDFCSPEVFGGGPVTNTRNAEAAQRASTFAAHAAGLGAHVVYTQQILDMGHLTARQRRWERPEGLCAAGTWGAGLFVEPVRGSSVVVKYRYDCWQSPSFTGFLDGKDIDGLVICGVELICCVLYAVLGAAERGYHYMVPQDLVSGQDPGTETGDKAVRDYLRFGHREHAIESSEEILSRWRARTGVFPRGGLSADTGAVSERLRVREIDGDEGQRLVRIIRRGTGSVVTWRRAQMVLLSAQGMDAAGIGKVAFTSEDRVRDVIRNFNADGFSSLYPKYKGGHPPKFTPAQRREIKKTAKSKPAEHDLPFSTWSLAKLADFLVAEGVVDDISHEGLRVLLREEGVTFQRLKTWKASKDPQFAAKKARAGHLYAIAGREVRPEPADPEVIFCVDEFGPLNLQPRPGRQWAAVSGKGKEPGRTPRTRIRATCTRTAGVRHLFAAYELGEDKLSGHIKPRKTRARFLEFCRYLRSLYPPSVRIAIVCDNFSPHLSTAKDTRVGTWAQVNNVEIAYTPTNSSWLNRLEAQFTALRYFALDGTDHASHKEQGSMIRRYIIWRNNHAYDERLRRIVDRANVA